MDDIQLVMKVDTAPVDRAVRIMDNLEAELRDVERAMDKNLITEKQYNAETQRLTQSMARLKTVAKGSSKDFRSFEKTVYGSGKAMRQKEIAMQQAGYQLQDFIVQVQAGTNPLIAFSQQGSQLAGFFAGPWGAAIGLGIAALGGLGTALLGTRNKGNEFREGMESLNTALEDYESITSRLSNGEGLSKEFGLLAGQAKEILTALQEIKKLGIKEQLGQFGGVGTVTTTTQTNAANSLRRLFGVEPVGPMETTMRDVGQVEAAQSFLGATEGTLMENAQYAGEFLRYIQQIQQAETFEGMVGPAGKLSEFLARHVELFNVQGEKLKDVEKLQETLLQITATQASAEETKNNKVIRGYQTAGKLMQEGVAAEEAARNQAYTNALLQIGQRQKKEIKASEEVERNRQSLMEATLQNATKANADRIQAETDADRVRQAMESRFREIKAEEDKALADQTHAHMMGLQKAYYEDAKTKAAETASATYLANYNAVMAYQAYGESRMAAPDKPVKPKKTPKTSKTPAQQLDEYMRGLERTVKLEQKQVGVSEEVARTLELREEYEKRGLKVNNSRIEALVREEEALRKATELQEKHTARVDMIGDAFGDMLMNVVDGTMKADDAFKSFMSSVLKQLYQEMAIDPAVSFLKSFLADGGVMSRGRLTAFANGGVVNGPTVFPMANGMGLMGEAGPEAIMPLKRGANGKLGVEGGGGVTVVQNINVSTGVQQTVRTEIKSLMPQIAEASKAAVADAKRRGGSYGRNFA